MTDIHWMTAGDLGRAYRAGTLTPDVVVEKLLERIAAFDGAINAFVSVDAEQARAQARAATRDMAMGIWRSPLHGVPVGIKDLIDIAGQVTSCHSRLMLDRVATHDATVVARLREAGAILLGKLALHEFAIGGPSNDAAYPPARNPWDTRHQTGGSSSGSGAAVAAGFVPIALGTDTGGSIRNPAGHCGVAGLKPTYGAISRHGVFPLCFTLDHVGPMARSVEDLALAMDVLAAHDPADPGSVSAPTGDHLAEINAGLAGLRFGIVRHFHEQDLRASDEVISAINHCGDTLRQAGAQVTDIQLPPLSRYTMAQRIIFHAESWAVHAHWLRTRPADYSYIARRKLMVGAFLGAGDYVQAQRWRKQLIEATDRALQHVDVLVVANSFEAASAIGNEAEFSRTYSRHARSPFNLTGHPALALMCGISGNGLPLSVQFVGRSRADPVLLRAGAGFERHADWSRKHPPVPFPRAA
ncbi:amidase [Achromobacter aloeverae]|uniref:Asp-tRNA(Asn)/Glu-tRNA(Gln) amidotransferase GatCAB subunit A n=1 Tax=Achromobacter aloeverae TaxID=1750518 RepID=A0A4V1MSP7_9BURK|nr:amidase [Achromobacter aloeverae]RXN92780.1 Asp-tRNA(Asn)/Glu-tRNA(Gln) amidotransferase GatCAB subunit A [Achromobacter aloeverae]